MLANVQDHELDRGTTSVAPGTERTCALTRSQQPVENLIRFVVGPDGDAVPDVKRKLPGRGIWITATREAVDEAVKRRVFARGFKRDVRVAPDLAVQTERLLERAALDALAMAGKAGGVLTGTSRVEAAIAQENVVALVHAADAADDGKRKLNAVLRRETAGKSREFAIIEVLTGAQLDLALGRPNVVHAALLAGPASATFLARVMRFAHFRTGQSHETVSSNAPTDGARG
jgi:uncharacterized protein